MDKKLQGKRNREKGRRFEAKVRKDLESKGWIVDRWTNNVELHQENSEEVSGIIKDGKFIYGKLIPAKSNRFNMRTTGFPDFIFFSPADSVRPKINGIECKSNGYLDKEERAKCDWLLKNNIFSRILIARKGEKRGQIIYKEFK